MLTNAIIIGLALLTTGSVQIQGFIHPATPLTIGSEPPGTRDGPTLIEGMTGIGSGNGVMAVDAEVAVGPYQVIMVTNVGVQLIAREPCSSRPCTNVTSALDGTFFTRQGSIQDDPRIADPDIIYDQRAERFWIVAVEVAQAEFGGFCQNPPSPITKGWLHVAVSKTSDPGNLTSDWEYFAIDIQGAPNEEAFVGVAHFLNIATDDDYLYVACTDSAECDLDGWRTTVLILAKELMLDPKKPEPPDLEWVRLHDITPAWGYGIGTRDS